MFLHGSWMHLIGNMLFLWVFADNIEATIGNFPFLFFYLLGGILASLAHVYFSVDSQVPSLGASGAISAVLGAYLVMFPRSQVKVLVFLFIIIRTITMSAFAFLGIWAFIQVFSTIQNFGIEDRGRWWHGLVCTSGWPLLRHRHGFLISKPGATPIDLIVFLRDGLHSDLGAFFSSSLDPSVRKR